MTESETRRIAREEMVKALEVIRPRAHEIHEGHEVIVADVDRALAALREPEPSAEPREASEPLPELRGEVFASDYTTAGLGYRGNPLANRPPHGTEFCRLDRALRWRDEAMKQKARADEAEKRGREKMREEVVAEFEGCGGLDAAAIVRRLP
jgi:hypothetical protein